MKNYKVSFLFGGFWLLYATTVFGQTAVATLFNNGAEAYNNKDYTTAVSCFLQAAQEYNDTQSKFLLGICYYNGLGIDQDFKTAIYWFNMAADKGHSDAQAALANCYAYGKGVDLNYYLAAYWYRKAALSGNAQAQNNLGICYLNGNGVTRDAKEAVKWFTQEIGRAHV